MLRSYTTFLSTYIQEIETRKINVIQRPHSILLDNSSQLEIALLNPESMAEFIPEGRGIRLIRIWEDQVIKHPEIIKSRLNSLLGQTKRIHARETEIKKIDQPVLASFLAKNHLNVPVKTKIKYGVFHEKELVAVAAFSKACPVDRGNRIYRSHELVRYCSLLEHTVVGGLSKVIRHFIREHDPEDIMTYVDKEWSDGSSYEKLGFEIVEQTGPQTFFISTDSQNRYYSIEEGRKKEGEHVEFSPIENMGNLKMIKFLI